MERWKHLVPRWLRVEGREAIVLPDPDRGPVPPFPDVPAWLVEKQADKDYVMAERQAAREDIEALTIRERVGPMPEIPAWLEEMERDYYEREHGHVPMVRPEPPAPEDGGPRGGRGLPRL
jgi:hypothetical protein